MLALKQLTKAFGGVRAIDNLTVSFEPHRVHGLIGPNGAGKTTLFNLTSGTLRPDNGEISFNGVPITWWNPWNIARLGIGRTFQTIRIFPKMTVLQNMMVPYGTDPSRSVELLEFVGLREFRDAPARELSYGQQKLLEFARALVTSPRFVLLDEPTAGVNPILVEKIMGHIRNLTRDGKTFIVIEHDMKVIMNLCERIVVLHNGEKIADGPPEMIKTNQQVIDAYFGD
ncbi:MAG: ABC transporter ATP-binding protein [Candidatus Rokubacteria bacterium]|nr:ABC transporter ATP-binding protein [Candidatus Rokubacteria bacterium]